MTRLPTLWAKAKQIDTLIESFPFGFYLAACFSLMGILTVFGVKAAFRLEVQAWGLKDWISQTFAFLKSEVPRIYIFSDWSYFSKNVINILIVSVLLCYFIKLAVFLKHIYHHLLFFFVSML